ncbi:hypothetical protein PVNG_01552 [Plasmodium vivax North Korean]|uniref:Uncharacterized protein n=1 Tax=Plasmodium vivax North Korean TaxID=1035514 RepID=A0A0J9U5I3_PLAVI|nr:hypothetical protein PVNG_01552 [Plasmodium vivax North Korean]
MEKGPTNNYEKLILENLSKYKLYEKFDKHDVESKYLSYCKENKRKFSLYNGIYDLCGRFAKNLKELSIIMNAENDSNERCRYLNFWTNDQIRKKMISNTNVKDSEINSIVRGFFSVSHFVNAESSHNKCRYEYYSAFNMDLWKKWKELYDYIRNKENISRIIVPNNGSCKIYQDYYAHIKSIYQEFKTECCVNKNENCPDHLKFNEWCNEEDILTELECNEPAEVREASSGSLQKNGERLVVEKAEEPEREPKEERAPEQGAEEPVVTIEGLAGIVGVRQAPESPNNRLVSTISGGHFSSETTELPTNGNQTNPVGTIVGTSLGFVLPLITIYRVKK